MNPALDVSDIVPVSINLSPTAIPYSNFGTLLIMGTSTVIDVLQRVRQYSNIGQILADFGLNSPEYLAALPYFSQTPTPNLAFVGRWAQNASYGLLHGSVLTPAQQVLANFTAITTGSLHIALDGTPHDITGINLSTALNLNGVASILQTAISAQFTGARVYWNSNTQRFDVLSGTTGAASSVSVATPAATGTDISTLLGLTAADGAYGVGGIAAESALASVVAAANVSSQWYGCSFAAGATPPSDSDHIAIASYILASSRLRRYGVTIQNTACLDPTQTSDLASVLSSMNNKRVFWQYSSTNPYAVNSFFGRAATVNFSSQNAALTLMFKQEPGVIAENLTETQYATLKAKGGNAFAAMSNGASIIMPGQNADGTFFDEVHNLDWFQNALQTDVFNILYQSTTKIPQTDSGANQLVLAACGTCEKAIYNGVAAPGLWNGASFGTLLNGDVLTNGYYVYITPMDQQSQAQRETRTAPPMQIALKGAGAIQYAPIIVNFNR